MSNQIRRRAAGALVAAAAALALPAAAGAAERDDWIGYEYASEAEGVVAISMVQESDSREVVETTRLRFDYKAEFPPELEFTRERELFSGASVGKLRVWNVDATITWVHADPRIEDVECSARSARAVNGSLLPLAQFQPQLPANSMQLVPFFDIVFDISCSKPGWRRLQFNLTTELRKELTPLQPVVQLDRADVGSDRIVRGAIRHSSSIERCPLHSGSWGIVSCESTFSGVVRFMRTYAHDELELAPLVPSKPKVTKKAKEVKAEVECRDGCEAEIGIFLRPVRGRGKIWYPGRGRGGKRPRAVASAAAARPVASWRVRVRPRRGPQTLTRSIPPAARTALLRAGRAHVAVQLDPPRGRTVRKDFAVAVPR
jgi:hypothetical protein